MPNTKKEPSRLELVKAGKLEERRASRPAIIIAKEEPDIPEADEGFKLTPEMMAIALMVVMLLILSVVGF
ncbi:MAG: hypothetical protein WC236_03855 [Gallionellaceae bacterium]|jgi:hypothetical protein